MAPPKQKRLFDVLTDLIATADVLTEQVEYLKRHSHILDHQADELADMCWDDRTMALTECGYVEVA